MDIPEIVARLDALSGEDPERAHSEADDLLLKSAHEDVLAAYERVVARSDWWAHA